MKVSIITATFNNRATIMDSVISTLSQQDVEFELIVVDGGSTDGTIEVLDGVDGRIDTLLSEPDQGMWDALNKGIRKAKGEVIGFMHSDDMFYDSQVLKDISFAFNDPRVDAAYGDLQYVDKTQVDRVFRQWNAGVFSTNKLSWGWMPPHPTLYLRRSVYEKTGNFNLQYSISADYDHILRVFSQPNFKSIYIPRVLVKMRVGGISNRNIRNIIQKSKEDYKALRSNGIGGVGALLWKNISKLGQLI